MKIAGIIGTGSTDNPVATRKLYRGGEAKLMYMESGSEKAAKNSNKKDIRHAASLIEHFIEEHSGDYNKKKLYAVFSDKIDSKGFKSVIASLRESGKIAIDRDGVIVWIWYPESRKEYLNPRNLVF